MVSFVGRESELNQVEQFCANDNLKLLCVVGEDGIGKTTLLDEFANRASSSYLIFNFQPESDDNINNCIFQWFKELQSGNVFFKGLDVWKKIMNDKQKINDFINFALSFEKASMSFKLVELLDRISTILDNEEKLVIIMDPINDLNVLELEELLKSFFSRRLEKVKIILSQTKETSFCTKNKNIDYSKVNILTLTGFSEDESKMKLIESGLLEKIGDQSQHDFFRKSKGNPLYLEYSIRLLIHSIRSGETCESALKCIPNGLDNLMWKLIEKINKSKFQDIVVWLSIITGKIELDMMSFLTSLPKDSIIDLLNNKEIDMIINFMGNREFFNYDKSCSHGKTKSSFIDYSQGKAVKHIDRKLSDTIIEKLIENMDDLSGRYKVLSGYFLKKSVDDKEDFESLRLYHLYLFRSMDKEAYIKATSGLVDKFYYFGLKDSCIEILERAIKYNKKLMKSKESYVGLISKVGILCYEQRQIDKAIEFFNQSVTFYKEIGDKEGEASDLGNIGIVYRDIFKVDESKNYLSKSLEIYSSIDDKMGQVNILSQLWKIDYELSNFNKAIEYLLKLMIVTKELGLEEKMPTILSNLGNLYSGVGNFDKAVIYYEQALVLSKKFGDSENVALCFSRIGIAYLYNKLHLESLEYFSNSLRIYKKIGNIQGKATQYGNIGITYKKMSKLDDALAYFKRSLELFAKTGLSNNIKLMKRNITTVKKMLEENENRKD